MEASTPAEEINEKQNEPIAQDPRRNTGGTFTCSFCPLKEHFDFKGAKPPFARQITHFEDCYIMKDPFSLPNKGEILVLGADCNICKKSVCLRCSIFYGKRFCAECASGNIHNLPTQIHSKIKCLVKTTDS